MQNEGGVVSSMCLVDGEPLPTISWYFNGIRVDESNMVKYRITHRLQQTFTQGILNVMDLESSDVGTYTCNATNVVSSDTSSGILTVNGEPSLHSYMI